MPGDPEDDREDVCRRCSYPLTGLDDRTACPECGLLVGLSRTKSEELRHARLGWLRKLLAMGPLMIVAYLAWPAGFASGMWAIDNNTSWTGGLYLDFAINCAIPLSGAVLGLLVYTLLRRVEKSGPSVGTQPMPSIKVTGLLWLGLLLGCAILASLVWADYRVNQLMFLQPTFSRLAGESWDEMMARQSAFYEQLRSWQDAGTALGGVLFAHILL
ncbi:MAG: hypothetical protein AAGK78_05200, partial [Planctomycetota bacterium]